MPLVLRVDVDKPYGRTTFTGKVFSKLRENYWFPAISPFGYLRHVKNFLVFLSDEKIKAHIYFRKCTLPPKRWLEETSLLDGHKIGLHAENTQNFETFTEELEHVQSHFHPNIISSFTKHGSGEMKLGKDHYPPYEPKKYLEWSKDCGVPFLFGNGEMASASIDLIPGDHYYPNIFWIDRCHSNRFQDTLQWIIDVAKDKTIVVIIHPANFIASRQVQDIMKELVFLARQQNIAWMTIQESR